MATTQKIFCLIKSRGANYLNFPPLWEKLSGFPSASRSAFCRTVNVDFFDSGVYSVGQGLPGPQPLEYGRVVL